MSNLVSMSVYIIFVHVSVHVLCADMYNYVYKYDFYVCSYCMLHLYVRYDYVQRCEDTVSVDLRCINYIFIIIVVVAAAVAASVAAVVVVVVKVPVHRD